MERKIVRQSVDIFSFDSDYNEKTGERAKFEIDKVISFFQEAKSRGATHVEWDGDTHYEGGVSNCDATTFFEREENDSEFYSRLTWEREKREAEEQMLRKQYENLKSRFGNT